MKSRFPVWVSFPKRSVMDEPLISLVSIKSKMTVNKYFPILDNYKIKINRYFNYSIFWYWSRFLFNLKQAIQAITWVFSFICVFKLNFHFNLIWTRICSTIILWDTCWNNYEYIGYIWSIRLKYLYHNSAINQPWLDRLRQLRYTATHRW